MLMPDLRIKLIHKTRDEQRDFHAAAAVLVFIGKAGRNWRTPGNPRLRGSAVPKAFHALGRKMFSSEDVVHVNRNAQQRREADEVGANVSVTHDAMVRAPIVHHGINIAERAAAGSARHEPGGRPGGIGALIQNGVDFFRQFDRFAFGNLQRRARVL